MRIGILLMVLFIIFIGWFSGYILLSLIGAVLGAYILSKPAPARPTRSSPEPQPLGTTAHFTSEGIWAGAKNLAKLSGFLFGQSLEIKDELSKVREKKKK